MPKSRPAYLIIPKSSDDIETPTPLKTSFLDTMDTVETSGIDLRDLEPGLLQMHNHDHWHRTKKDKVDSGDKEHSMGIKLCLGNGFHADSLAKEYRGQLILMTQEYVVEQQKGEYVLLTTHYS
jgi:hypothetical protein